MRLLNHYLLLKLKLFYRGLGKHRAPISVVLGLLLTFAISKVYSLDNLEYNKVILGVFGMVLLLVQYHVKRSDKDFLINQIGKAKMYLLLIVEYLIISIPIFTFLLSKGFQEAYIFLALPFLLPFLPNNIFKSSFHFSLFGKGNFEWNSGLRIFGLFQWILLFGFVVSCAFKVNFHMSMALMALMLISISFYYSINENEQMIIPYRSAKELIHSKLLFLLKNMVILSILFSLILVIFYQQFDWIILLIIGQSIVLSLAGLLVKYSYYPNKNASDLQLSILFIIGLIPFLSPLLLILCFHYYGRAIKRINPYFNYKC